MNVYVAVLSVCSLGPLIGIKNFELYNDFMFEYYIIFWSFSLNDIYWIYVFVYIYSQFQKQVDLLLYITGRCLCWPCLHHHQFIISFDVMMLLLSFRVIWNFEVRHK